MEGGRLMLEITEALCRGELEEVRGRSGGEVRRE